MLPLRFVVPGRREAANPESRDSGSGPSDHPGMTARELLSAVTSQLPLVRRIVRLVDGELVHGGLPEMIGKPGRLQVEFAVRDTVGERAVEFGERAPHAQ